MRSCTRTNCSPMMWRLSSGSRTDSSGSRNSCFAAGDLDHARAELREGALDELRFAFAHEPGIHVNAAHPLGPERAQAEREGNGGIDAAADEKEDVAVADALPDLVFHQRDALARIPVFLAAADVEDEVFENARALRGVDHFGVELHAVEPARRVFDSRGVAGGCGGEDAEAGGRRGHHIAMRHPDLLVIANAVQQSANRRCRQDREWPGQTRLCRPCEPIRRAAARSAAGRSRCRGPECPPSGQPRSIDGAGIVVNAVRAAGDDDAARVAQLLKQAFRSGTPRTKLRVPVFCGRSGGSTDRRCRVRRSVRLEARSNATFASSQR